jgi:hypothetical protein
LSKRSLFITISKYTSRDPLEETICEEAVARASRAPEAVGSSGGVRIAEAASARLHATPSRDAMPRRVQHHVEDALCFFFWQFVREHGCHCESELLQVVLHVFLSLLLPDVELS